MKEFFDVTLLAVLQGIAEFLPISSSGHLVIAQSALGVNAPGVRLDVFLHVGTVLAIFVYYRATLRRLIGGFFASAPGGRRASWAYAGRILVSALPAVGVYGLFSRTIHAAFESPLAVGVFLIVTGAVLCVTRFLPRGASAVTLGRAAGMGLAQAAAILPGISRSGMTLTAARAAGVATEAAAEFSFLMSVPLILGAAFLEIVSAATASAPAASTELGWGVIAYATVISAVVGYFALAGLVKAFKGRWFWLFGPYCLLAGTGVVVYVLLNPQFHA